MPIFEYRCKECGTQFEALVLSSKSEEIECEKCGSRNTEKLMSTFSSAGQSQGSSAASGGCASHGGHFT